MEFIEDVLKKMYIVFIDCFIILCIERYIVFIDGFYNLILIYNITYNKLFI